MSGGRDLKPFRGVIEWLVGAKVPRKPGGKDHIGSALGPQIKQGTTSVLTCEPPSPPGPRKTTQEKPKQKKEGHFLTKQNKLEPSNDKIKSNNKCLPCTLAAPPSSGISKTFGTTVERKEEGVEPLSHLDFGTRASEPPVSTIGNDGF